MMMMMPGDGDDPHDDGLFPLLSVNSFPSLLLFVLFFLFFKILTRPPVLLSVSLDPL